jgi:hypothetical protein
VDASLLNKSDSSPENSELIVAMEESKDSVNQIQDIVERELFEKSADIDNKNEKYEIQNISNHIIIINPNLDNTTTSTNKNSLSCNPKKVDNKFTTPTEIPSLQKNKSDSGSLSNFLSKFSNSFYLKQIKVSPEKKDVKEREIKNIVSPELLLAAKSADIEIDDLGKPIVVLNSLLHSLLSFFDMISMIAFCVSLSAV